MSDRRSQPAYTADVSPKPGVRGKFVYQIHGPRGLMVEGEYTGTRGAADKHVGKTLKRLNQTSPYGRNFRINRKKAA